MLEIRSLEGGYGEIDVLWDVSLDVAAGETVAIIGPNGAGKTTLINAISGVIERCRGAIMFCGRDIAPLAAESRVALGIVQCPEGRQLFPEMTVEENLRMGAFLCRDSAETRRRLDGIFDLFGILGERRSQLAGTLSGGQQQMVALGRAMMAKPRLLLLDEPSLGLAPIVVSDVFALIRKIHDTGTTVLIVEQNVRQTLELADRAYVLENGRIALSGSAREVLEEESVRRAYLGG